jgi:hypothetical protein
MHSADQLQDEKVQYQNEQIGFLQAQLRLERSRTPVQGLMTIDQFLVAIDAVDHIEQSTTDIEKYSSSAAIFPEQQRHIRCRFSRRSCSETGCVRVTLIAY